MAANLKPNLTFDEYLDIEGKAEFKSEFDNPKDTIFLPSINCELALLEVYDEVK